MASIGVRFIISRSRSFSKTFASIQWFFFRSCVRAGQASFSLAAAVCAGASLDDSRFLRISAERLKS